VSVVQEMNQVALDRIGKEGATEEEIGAALHSASGFHAERHPCTACKTVGRDRLRHLKSYGMVRRQRNGLWVKVI
jgi:hypothetical protein